MNVLDFGAIVDDGIDDTGVIQKAFDFASAKGRILFFPKGIYNINKKLVFRSELNLEGEDKRTTILLRGAMMRGNWTYAKAIHNVQVRNLGFDGNEANQPIDVYSTTLRFDQCSNLEVDNCFFTRTGERSIDFRACEDVVISNSYFRECGINNPDGNEGNAISIDILSQNKSKKLFSRNIIVSECLFEKFGDTAIGCPQGDNIQIYSNKIFGRIFFGEIPLKFESAISLNGATNCIVKNNRLDHINNFGIACISRNYGSSPWVVSNIEITENEINYVKKTIRIEGRMEEKLFAQNVLIEKNDLSNCEGSIWLRHYVKGVVIKNNVFRDSGKKYRANFFESYAAIRIYNSQKVKVFDNQFRLKCNNKSGMSHCIYINGDLVKNIDISNNFFEDYKKSKIKLASNIGNKANIQVNNAKN